MCTTANQLRVRDLRAFTLLELLVTVAIVAVLLGILVPAISGVVAASRGLRCQMNMREVAFDFTVFADDAMTNDRGDDEDLGRGRFTIETFQESLYGISEFWRYGKSNTIELNEVDPDNPMLCPAVRDPVVLRSNAPCSGGGVGPNPSVSYAFNLFLHREEVELAPGAFGLRPRQLQTTILQKANVPLLLDADGLEAATSGVPAVYTSPAAAARGPIATGRFWFPEPRHAGKVNVAFIGGHVLSRGVSDLEDIAWDPTESR